MQNPATPEPADPPVVFISYSHTNDDHAAWVANLARRLRTNGIDVYLDRWHVGPGRDLNLFMERYADLSARVLVVLSDDYAPKANSRDLKPSGVGTEATIVTPTVYRDLALIHRCEYPDQAAHEMEMPPLKWENDDVLSQPIPPRKGHLSGAIQPHTRVCVPFLRR